MCTSHFYLRRNMNVAVIVLSVLNTLLIYLALAAAGRIIRQQNENMDVLVRSQNIIARRVSELSEVIEGGLDCLLTIDARPSQSSNKGGNVR